MIDRRRGWLRAVVACLTLSTAAACSESAAPAPSIAVALSLDGTIGPDVRPVLGGQQTVSCQFAFAARTTGDGKGAWDGGVMRFYAGKERFVPADSLILSSYEAGSFWGDTTIVQGNRKSPWLGIESSLPFTMVLELRYRVNTEKKITSTQAYCGRDTSSTTPAPVISDVVVDPITGDLEPGGTVTVHFGATSSIGLWRSSAMLSGPCEVVRELNEPLVKSTARTVTLSLPASCEFGPSLSVTVFATDAIGRTTARQIHTPYVLTDKVAPQVSAVTNSGFGNSGPTTQLTGTYFSGDTVDLQLRGRDNSRSITVLWEAFGGFYRDSITVADSAMAHRLRLPIPAGWLGSVDVRVTARDGAGNRSSTIVAAPGALEVLPTVTRQVRTIPGAGGVEDAVIDNRRSSAYLLETNDQRVSVVSFTEGRVTRTIPLSSRPSGMDITAGGDSLIVGLPVERALGIIDLRAQSPVVTKLAIPGYEDPTMMFWFYALRTASNGKVFVIFSKSESPAQMLEVDLASKTQRIREDAVADTPLSWVLAERSVDHSTIAVRKDRCIGRYDAATDRFNACTTLSGIYESMSLDRTGQRILAALDLYDAAWQRRTLQRPVHLNTPKATALSADGAEAYYGLVNSGVARVRTSDGKIMERIPSPVVVGRPFLSSDGRWLLGIPESVGGYTGVVVIDLQTPSAVVRGR